MRSQHDVNHAYDFLSKDYLNISQNRQLYCRAVDNLVVRYSLGKTLLDIGSASGNRIENIRSLLNLSLVHSIEPSYEMYLRLIDKPGIVSYNAPVQHYLPELKGKFDTVTALWNVLGHIPTEELLRSSLMNIHSYMKDQSLLLFDVNNRHNISSYGFRALTRFIVDQFDFRRDRGDTTIYLSSSNKQIPLHGHLFALSEIKSILLNCGFSLHKIHFIDYDTGVQARSRFGGQIFISARRIT